MRSFMHVTRRLAGRRRGIGHPKLRVTPHCEPLERRQLMAADLPLGPALAERVGRVVGEILANSHIPGMGVAVTYNGRVVLAEGYGVRDTSTGEPVGPDTGFALGSVTKTFTAMGLLLIYDHPALITKPGISSLELDAPIGRYLSDTPEFKLPESWDRITTRQLLQMSGGMADIGGVQPWYEMVDEVAKKGLQFEPGAEYLYSNASFFVLGELIQQLTTTPYPEFIHRHITGPLGLDDTQALVGEATSVPGEAVGYQSFDPRTGTWTVPDRYRSGLSAFSSGSIISTAEDLGAYMGALWGRELLSETAYGLMWSPTPLRSFDNPSVVATPGFGWADADGVVTTRGGIIVNKGGATPGYSSLITMDFASGFGLAICYNLSLQEGDPGDRPRAFADDIMAAITTASISGTLYADLDGAGTIDPGDPRLAGWQVYLDANANGQLDPGETSALTNTQGAYSFDRVPAGPASVRVVPAADWWPVSPAGGRRGVEVGPSDAILSLDFGFSRLAEVVGVGQAGRGPGARIILTFGEGLDPATAADPRNYKLALVGPRRPGGARASFAIPIASASYDPASRTVSLRSRYPSLAGRSLLVKIDPGAVKNAAGLPLDGDDDGRPGGGFEALLRRRPPIRPGIAARGPLGHR